MAPIVRRARAEDLDAIVRLWREMWDYHAAFDPNFQSTPAAEAVMSGWIEDNMNAPRSAVFVAEGAARLDGYCMAMILENPPVLPLQFFGYVSEISVREKRRGVGAALLRAVHAWFREHGLSYAEVNVSVRNAAARSFWRKQGYGEFLERLRVSL